MKPKPEARRPDATACPCDSGRPYHECCGLWHTGPLAGQAPTPEALMRSRYSAFVLDLRSYLLASWHPRTRPDALEPPPPGLTWLGLQVRHSAQLGAEHATVEFVARSKLAGRAHRLHETSRFVFEDGRWFYLDGQVQGGLGPS